MRHFFVRLSSSFFCGVIGYWYGKRTSILQDVAISVKKMSVFVVLHRRGTGTLLERGQPGIIIISRGAGGDGDGGGGGSSGWLVVIVMVRRWDGNGTQSGAASGHKRHISIAAHWNRGHRVQRIGRTDGRGQRKRRPHRGRRKRPKSAHSGDLVLRQFFFCFLLFFSPFFSLTFLK